jgi:hypothetical protein
MPAQAGIQLFQQDISGFPPARLCRNWQNYSYWCFRHSGLDPESSAFSRYYTLLDAGSSPALHAEIKRIFEL